MEALLLFLFRNELLQFEKKNLFEEFQFVQVSAVSLSRSPHCRLDVIPVVTSEILRAYIGAINGKAGEDLLDGALQSVEGYIAAIPVPSGNLFQEASEIVHITFQVFLDDEFLLPVNEIPVRRGVLHEPVVYPAHLSLIVFLAENAVYLIEKIVARRSLDGPELREPLLASQDLLDHKINLGSLIPDFREVCGGIIEPVDVVDPQAGDRSLPEKTEDECVYMVKNMILFHAQRNEPVDIEESPVIDLFRRHLPESEAEILFREEIIEEIEALRFAPLPVEQGDAGIHSLPYGFIAAVKLPEDLLGESDLL